MGPKIIINLDNLELTLDTHISIFESLSNIIVSSANRKLNKLEHFGKALPVLLIMYLEQWSENRSLGKPKEKFKRVPSGKPLVVTNC